MSIAKPKMTKVTNDQNIQGWSAASFETLDSFGEFGDFARQHLLNPALFSLLGNVKNKKILDAGCGQGYLSRLLAKKGATVTGLEPAKDFIQYAIDREEKEKLGITYIKEDLSKFEVDEQFDAVVSNMVFMDIPNYRTAIHNCIKSLKQVGSFVFSISHPCFFLMLNGIKNNHLKLKNTLRNIQKNKTLGIPFIEP